MQKIPVTDTRGIIVRALQKALDEDPNFIKLVIDLDDALGLKVLNDQLDELNDDELKSIDVDILEEFTHQIFELIENGKGRNGNDVIWEGGDAPPTDLDMLQTTKMLANTLLVSPRTVEAWRISGEGPPFIKIGPHRIAYRWGSTLAWLNSRESRSTSEEMSPVKTIKRQFDQGIQS